MSTSSRKFFKEFSDQSIETLLYARPMGVFTVEELYQAFKERLMEEMAADARPYRVGMDG